MPPSHRPDITAGGQVDPNEDHGDRMEEADQEFEDLLHYLNLPAALAARVRSLRIDAGTAGVCRTSALSAEPVHVVAGAPQVATAG